MSPISTITGNQVGGRRRAALNFAAGTLWYIPGSFSIVRLLERGYSLRCVLFHNVSDTESPFTKGLGVTITRKNFESALKFIAKHYTPVSLQDVLTDFSGRPSPLRPVLVTFDDAYASVSELALPLCSKFGVPSVFFVNAACLDNRQLALDNLICYVANTSGMDAINTAIRTVGGVENFRVRSLKEVFARFLPSISLTDRRVFRDALIRSVRVSESDLAASADVYLSSHQLRDLATFNCEIGNHTYSHVNCRSLLAAEFAEEIDQNRAVLEATSGTKVRSFSVPYGSSADLTNDLLAHLQRSGYEAAFLSESRANSRRTHQLRLNRVSIKTGRDSALFSEIELLPRLRMLRNWVFAASYEARSSDYETAMPGRSPRFPGKDAGTSTAAPKGVSGR